jgi:hypothetical protein|tara:strand:+ start:99 stop:386 length:288 start_codon:yes stop_codon:yes gene_type:complete
MNRKKSKRIRNHTEVLQIEWLKSLLSDEEASKINLMNFKEMLPKQTHIWAQGTIHNSFYTAKWLSIKIKQLLRIFPDKQVEDITSEDVKWKMEQR